MSVQHLSACIESTAIPRLTLTQGSGIAAWLDERASEAWSMAKQTPRNSSDRAILAGAEAAFRRAASVIRGATMTSDT